MWRSLEIFGTLASRPLRIEAWKEHARPDCITMPNLFVLGQTVRTSVWDPKNLGDAGRRSLKMGRLRPRILPSPQVFPQQIWSFWVKRLVRNWGDSPEKFVRSRPAFQGHSRSLEATWIDRLPVTSYYIYICVPYTGYTVSQKNCGPELWR